jgi:epoxyqueuosine reductase QueG
MTSKKISLTGDDLTSALDALYENWVSEEVRARHDANSRREAKQYLLDAVWPGFAALIDLANKHLAAHAADIWQEGRAADADVNNPYIEDDV